MRSLRSQALSLLVPRPRLYRSALRLKGTLTSEIWTFTKFVRRGNVVFDVGANRGRFTVLFSRLVGSRGRVHAFEPVPPTFTHLADYVREEGATANTELVSAAASDRAGRFTMYLPGTDDGQASLAKQSGGSWVGSSTTEYTCEATTLDEYVASRNVAQLDFVKCDVEGAELLALRGAKETLARFRPTLYLEANPECIRAFGNTPQDLWSALRSAGYERIYCVRAGVPLPTPFSERELPTLDGYTNLLCLSPRERTSF
jgi:FkbM family methyltransferase